MSSKARYYLGAERETTIFFFKLVAPWDGGITNYEAKTCGVCYDPGAGYIILI